MTTRANEIKPETTEMEPAPDWNSRPWGRPTVHWARNELSPRLVGIAEFKYYGMRVRGIRIFEHDNGTLSVNMPQKRMGETVESVLYFHDPLEREQFTRDIVWLFWSIFARRLKNQRAQAQSQPMPRQYDSRSFDDEMEMAAVG
jgi:hypothetical protein